MNNIRIKFSHIPGLTGPKTPLEVHMDLRDGDTVRSLISRFMVSHANDVYIELIDPTSGQLRNDFVIMLNGENILAKDGLDTRLKANDEILILAVTAGG